MNSSNNRMTILDRKNDVRHRFVQGKQMLDMTHPGIVFAGSKNDNNLSSSLGDRWDADDYFCKEMQRSVENERVEFNHQDNQGPQEMQKRKGTQGKKARAAPNNGLRTGTMVGGGVKANSRLNSRSRRWVEVNGTVDAAAGATGAGNFTPIVSNVRNRPQDRGLQAMMGGRKGYVGAGARRNNFMDEAKSNLSNISMLNENNHSLKGADRASLKSRSLNQPSSKTKMTKSRRAAQRVLMDRSQNIGEMLRGGANALKASLQQPICSPTEPSFIRFQSQRSYNSLSKAGSANGGRQGLSVT